MVPRNTTIQRGGRGLRTPQTRYEGGGGSKSHGNHCGEVLTSLVERLRRASRQAQWVLDSTYESTINANQTPPFYVADSRAEQYYVGPQKHTEKNIRDADHGVNKNNNKHGKHSASRTRQETEDVPTYI